MLKTTINFIIFSLFSITSLFAFDDFYEDGNTQENVENNQLAEEIPVKDTPRKEKVRKLQSALVDSSVFEGFSPGSKMHFNEVVEEERFSGREIKNSKIKEQLENGSVLFSPFARKLYKRPEFVNLLNKGVYTHLSAMAFVELDDLTPETKEEKEARLKEQKAFFMDANQVDQKVFDNLLDKEAMLWKSFVEYILEQVDLINKNQRQKIRPEELESAAELGPLTHYKSVEINGKMFFYHPEILDLNRLDGFENSNIEKMKKGNNPIGPDGLIMQVHHITIRDDCPVFAYLTCTLHQGLPLKRITGNDEATLHPPKSHCLRTEIDRSEFSKLTRQSNEKIAEEGHKQKQNDMEIDTDDEKAQWPPLSSQQST